MLNSAEILYLISCIGKKKVDILEKLIVEYNKATEIETSEEVKNIKEGLNNFKDFVSSTTWRLLEMKGKKSLFIPNSDLKKLVEYVNKNNWLKKIETKKLVHAITLSCKDNGYKATYPVRLREKPPVWGLKIEKIDE